jgi:ribonuclease BN (tRNA processing enzyme)
MNLAIFWLLAAALPDGSQTTPKNYLNDPFVPQGTITSLNLPECWPQYYNRGPLDFSPKDKSSKLVILGSGMPVGNPYRFGPAHALIVKGFPYFVDCGEGWFRALTKATITQGAMDLNPVFTADNLKYLFITHLHEDHTVGIPSFLLGPLKFHSRVDKKIYGPKGIASMVAHIDGAWKVDREEMFEGPLHVLPGGDIATGIEINPDVEFPGPIFEDDNVKVEAFQTVKSHGALKYTYAYRFTTKPDGRIIAFGGDGHYSKGLVEAAKGADILVIEGITKKNIKYAPWGGKTVEEKLKNIGAYHMFPDMLKKVQHESGVKQIVMVHEQNYNSPEDYSRLGLQKEMEEAGVKNIFSSCDGDMY